MNSKEQEEVKELARYVKDIMEANSYEYKPSVIPKTLNFGEDYTKGGQVQIKNDTLEIKVTNETMHLVNAALIHQLKNDIDVH